jgi:hypothetical protein
MNGLMPDRAAAVQGGAALLLLSSRIACFPSGFLWRDWVSILCGFWILLIFFRKEEQQRRITLCVLWFLLGIYVAGHLGYTLHVLGLPQ